MAIDIDGQMLDSAIALSEFSLGTLSPAKHVIISCQSEISDEVKADVEFQDHLAASLMVNKYDAPLSADFFDRLAPKLNEADEFDCRDFDIKTIDVTQAPKTPEKINERYVSKVKWKTLVPGVSISRIMGSQKGKREERLYLLKAKAGMKMPNHSHNGEEWTLILSGSYRVGTAQYSCGDLHISNDNDEHAPHIDDGEDCICLVMTEGPLKMRGLLPRLLQPVIGV